MGSGIGAEIMNTVRNAECWPDQQERRCARRVQSRLLPRHGRPRGRLDFFGLCQPERGVGGDFYDFIDARPGCTAMVVGDVSGKGVPAALLAAAFQASLRTHYAVASIDLARRLHVVNRVFAESTAVEHFVSLFVGEYEQASGRLRYANCGHVPPIVLRKTLRDEHLEATATVLGWFDDWTCDTAETTLEAGDIVLVVSDGVTESMASDGEFFGDARLLAALVANRERRIADLVRAIADEARRFRNGGPGDDVTLVAARVRHHAGALACTLSPHVTPPSVRRDDRVG